MSAAVADRQPSDRRGGRLKRSEAAEEAQVAAGSADQTSRRSRGRGSKGQTEAHKAISGENVPGVLQVEESTTEPVGRRRQTRVAAGVKSGDVDLQEEATAPPPQHQPESPPLPQPVASTEVETSSRMGRRKRVTGGNEKKENSTSSVAEQENSVERVSSGTSKSSVTAEQPSDEAGKRARGRPLKNSRERMGEEQPTTTPIDGSSGTRSVRSAGGRSTTSLRSEASVASSSSSTSTITKKPTAKRSRVANTTQETEIPRVEEDEEMAGKRKRGRGKTPQSEAATAKRKYRSEPASSESETPVGR